jgi:hypothetical protein
MWALVAAVVCVAIAVPIVLYTARRDSSHHREALWNLPEAASRQVIIAGGLAGFAVTGMVLLITLARDRADVETDAFRAVVFMFLTAYLFFVATAFMFAFLPKEDADGHQPAHVQFSLAANLQFRSVMIAWFALRPLMQTFGLEVLADFAGGAITMSIALGGLFVIAILRGVGVLTLTEVVILPLITTGTWLSVGILAVTAVPDLQSSESALYLTAGIYSLNVVTFVHFAVGMLAITVPWVRRVLGPYSRRVCVAEVQATMIMLAFLWMAVMGIL